jgi:hypothetical protein
VPISVDRPLAYLDLLWPDAHTGPFYVRITIDEMSDKIGVSGFVIFGKMPGLDPTWSGRTVNTEAVLVSPRTIHSVPVGALSASLLNELRTRWAPLIAARCQSDGAQRSAVALRNPGPKRGRPPLYDHAHFAEVERVYRGSPGRPVMAVAEAFNVSRWTAVGWVRRARALGLIGRRTGVHYDRRDGRRNADETMGCPRNGLHHDIGHLGVDDITREANVRHRECD